MQSAMRIKQMSEKIANAVVGDQLTFTTKHKIENKRV